MEFHACTIIARNYLPAARVLARSFRQHNPGGNFTTLVVDDINAEVDEGTEPFTILRLDDIGIAHDEALRMAAIYDVTELCTAVKPWLLQTLLDRGATTVTYLDPDIKVYAPLDQVEAATTEHGIVLTPHVTRPMPRDGLSKSETEVLLSGIYNLGFISVSGNAEAFLSFWKVRLKRECIVDPHNMRFVDQRWVDFVPGFYPVCILRDPSYNVAYWNLDHRDLLYHDGVYLVDEIPLHFFHFSGYSPDAPYLLSKHQGQRPRILLSDWPDIARICDEYGAELVANGYGQDAATEYGFKRLGNGIVFDHLMRRLYRNALLNAERIGTALPPNPLVAGNELEFLTWLDQAPEEHSDGRLNRYLCALHAERPDLQKAFPDPHGTNFQSFATWVRHEVSEGRLDSRFSRLPVPSGPTRLKLNVAMQLARVERRVTAVPVPGTGNERVRLNMAGSVRRLDRLVTAAPLPPSADRMKVNLTRSLGRLERRLAAVPVPGTGNERVRLNLAKSLGRVERRLTAIPGLQTPSQNPFGEGPAQEDLPPGIRVSGYLRTESGVGELGRLALATVRRAGITTSSYVDTNVLSRQHHPFEPFGRDLNVNLVCVNADELPNFARRVGPAFFSGHYTIGLWAWELEEFPQKFSTSFDYVDEVWSISEYARKGIATISTKPVYAFPLPIVEPQVDMTVGRSQLGLPDGFMFLFCFDLLSIFERKNPLGLIEAFGNAFRPGEGPLLVIKAVNSQFETGSLEQLKLAASHRPDIILVDKYLDSETNMALMVASDCYVSLHRSEGYGLTMAEAMALGKPVIATGYSGNLDFMTADTSYLVPWAPGKVPIGCSPYPAGAHWAEPDLDAAARVMREVYEHPSQAAELGRRAKTHVFANHGLDARASFVAERFDAAQAKLLERKLDGGRTENPSTPATSPLMESVKRPRSLGVPSNHPRSARLFRRLVGRALRSHDDHDREVHVQLAAAIDELSTEVAILRRESGRLEPLEAKAGAALQAGIEGQRERVDAQQQQLDAQQQQLDAQHQRLDSQEQRVEAHERRLQGLEGPERWRKVEAAIATSEELHAIPFMTKPDMLLTMSSDGRPAIGYREGGELSDGYVSFEDVFRGPEQMIRDRLRPYLSILADHSPVLDVGCGRGELLDLLSRAGIDALGVDIDASMVQRAKDKGHQVIQQDAIEYLAQQPSTSLGAVFAAQVAEHLAAEALLRLLQEAQRVLRPDGLLILETVNPYSIQAFKAFWTDLTHRNPIYPEALAVYCAEAGFQEALVTFPNGSGDLARDRWTEGEYAVVARNRV